MARGGHRRAQMQRQANRLNRSLCQKALETCTENAVVEELHSHMDEAESIPSEPTSPLMPAPFGKEPALSTGSKLHHSGGCKPCAWYWKQSGCLNGQACSYCHLCPAEELKKRKRAKIASMRKDIASANLPEDDSKIPSFVDASPSDSDSIGGGTLCTQSHAKSSVATENAVSPSIPRDQTSTGNQLQVIVKNTFIHLELRDFPEACVTSAANDLVASAGILFTFPGSTWILGQKQICADTTMHHFS